MTASSSSCKCRHTYVGEQRFESRGGRSSERRKETERAGTVDSQLDLVERSWPSTVGEIPSTCVYSPPLCAEEPALFQWTTQRGISHCLGAYGNGRNNKSPQPTSGWTKAGGGKKIYFDTFRANARGTPLMGPIPSCWLDPPLVPGNNDVLAPSPPCPFVIVLSIVEV